MTVQSKWVINETTNTITRASTLRPRLEFASDLVDRALKRLAQKKFELDKINKNLYTKIKNKHNQNEFQNSLSDEIEISRAIEALRQVHRCIDSVFGIDNIVPVLAPIISLVRTIRSRLFCLVSDIDVYLGELSLIIGGMIIDSGHLTGANLDFKEANKESDRLLDEAKLIADSKIYKQFPNVEFL